MNRKLKLDSKEIIELKSFPSLGSGGEGAVYKILSPNKYKNNFCVKVYTKPIAEKEKKIRYLIDNSPSGVSNKLFKICWPKNLVYENGNFCGYLMPLAFDKSENLLDLMPLNFYKKPKLSQDFKNLYDREKIEGILNRAKLCTNISVAIHTIHKTNKYVLVDLKPDNILVTLNGKISIVDFDSVQVSDGRIFFPAAVCTPEYTPPEYYIGTTESKRKLSWDRFSFAVIFYEIIFGIHPFTATFTGRFSAITDLAGKIQHGLFVHGKNKSYIQPLVPQHPHNKFIKILPQELQKMFIHTFDKGHTKPEERISIDIFGKAFYNAIKNTSNASKKKINKKNTITAPQNQSIFIQKYIFKFEIFKKQIQDITRKVLNIIKTIVIALSIVFIVILLINIFKS